MSELASDFQYNLNTEVHSFQVSPEGKISWYALADWCQEIAWRHANSAGFGLKLAESGQLWALARLEIRAEELPSWGDRIRIYTAGRGVNKIFAFREFLITDPDGKVLVSGMSSWLLLDSLSKRPLRPELVLPKALFDPTLIPSWQPEKIQVAGNLKFKEPIRVKPSDLDLNRHVNNTSYIRWAEDLLIQHGYSQTQFAINYLSECHINDEVVLELYQDGALIYIQGTVSERKVFTSRWS